MSSNKLETLDAFFRRNTHPSRKEKEAICKDLDMDLKTVTIWFQNKRQNLARSRRQLSSENTSASLASVPVQPGSVPKHHIPTVRPLMNPHLDLNELVPAIQFPRPTLRFSPQPRVPLSAVTHDPHVFVFEPVRTEMPSSNCDSSPFPDLRKPCLRGNKSIHPEDPGNTSPHHLRSLLCLPQTSALILVLPLRAAGS
ncbi:hypothetical protein BGY98DRAFT_1096938 [Russula aff. rugulosa BPL654]|nr:hypothetical protein BGY98DRAFT_1096938 [Russula aff. rugulosa BPL654]